jgi:hypothetical protein
VSLIQEFLHTATMVRRSRRRCTFASVSKSPTTSGHAKSWQPGRHQLWSQASCSDDVSRLFERDRTHGNLELLTSYHLPSQFPLYGAMHNFSLTHVSLLRRVTNMLVEAAPCFFPVGPASRLACNEFMSVDSCQWIRFQFAFSTQSVTRGMNMKL